jgi:hypothetical protein
MSNTLTVQKVEKAQKTFRVRGIVALTGSYVQAPTGEILDFSKAVMPLGEALMVSKGPTSLDVWGNTGYSYEPIGTLGGATLQVPIQIKGTAISSGTPTTSELSAGAYAAPVLADFIQFEAVFDALI